VAGSPLGLSLQSSSPHRAGFGDLPGGDALDGLDWMPGIWAQATSGPLAGGAGPAPSTPSGAGSLLALSLRRWFGSLTLSPPSIQPGAVPEGVWALLAGVGALLVVVLAVQGPRRALGQLVDIRSHLALLDAALGRLRRSGRLLMVVVGVSVVSWTAAQGLRYAGSAGRDDLALLLRDRRVTDVAWAQGTLAALTPLRDVVGLSLMIPMLLVVTFVLFQYSTFRWSAIRPHPSIRVQATRWATIGWGSTALYAIYRFVGFLASGGGDRPLGGCLSPETVIIPALMALADGVVLAWVLVELRHAGGRTVAADPALRPVAVWDSGGGTDDDRLDVTGIVLAIPAAVVGCLLTFPARYIATGFALGSDYLLAGTPPDPNIASFLRWELSWGLIVWQAVGLVFVGWLGAAAWSRGVVPWGALRGFGRLLVNDGARLVVILLAGGVSAGVLAAVAYALILSLPGATWVLSAADSYAHYATLPVGLIMLAALVELGGRSVVTLPVAASKPETEEWADLPA